MSVVALTIAWIVFGVDSNSQASRIKADERVVFFDTAARFVEKRQSWILPIHGWIHEPEDSTVRKAAFARILEKKYGLRVSGSTRQNFDRRINLFLTDNERGKRIEVRIGKKRHVLPPSGPNGHFHAEVELTAAEVENLAVDGQIPYTAVLPEGDRRRFPGAVHLIGPTGISVISDIDDTIKITQVTERAKMLEHTFFRDFRAAPGMAELYGAWSRKRVRFHLVSSSPWQLYEPLREFTRRSGFPAATFHLKSVRLTDRTILNLFKKGTETKPAQVEPLLKAYPGRRFILIGDSGEQDPEVYAELCRRFPGQVERVYIRNVTKASRSDERFRKAFQSVDPHRWRLFTDPTQLTLPELAGAPADRKEPRSEGTEKSHL